MAEQTIGSLIRELEKNYIDTTTSVSKYVDFQMSEVIDTIYAYINSKHISGLTDSQGREKPFFNIVTAAVNIWYRATDIDRKNIRIKATKAEDTVKAFVATVLLQDYMRRENFGAFLNTWGRELARFGSAVVKFVDKGSELSSEVVPWNRLIVDAIDFDANPVIEVIELTPAQLRGNKGYDQDMVEALIKTAQASRENLSGHTKDNLSNYIKLYEIHGNLPVSYLTDKEEDEYKYTQQMHVISFVEVDNGEFEDFTLISGKENNPYLITSLIKEEGQTLSIGAVQHLFEAQWMVNNSQKAIKDQLDLVSKVVFQTSDGNFTGRNMLKSIQNGDVMIHAPNQPLTQVANNSHDIASLQSYQDQWEVLGTKITSTPDAISGNTFPSGTAYRQVVALQQEAHGLFEIMTENKGLSIEQMMRLFILPFVKRKMNTTKELSAILDEQQIKKIDSMFIPGEAIRRANNKIIEKALQGEPTNELEQDELIAQEEDDIVKAFAEDGNQRFIKPSDIESRTWAEELEGLEWDLEVEVTGETSDKEAVMTTLTTVLQSIASNPAVLQDPTMKMLFNKILTATGEVSPLELNSIASPQQQEAPQGQPQGDVGQLSDLNQQ